MNVNNSLRAHSPLGDCHLATRWLRKDADNHFFPFFITRTIAQSFMRNSNHLSTNVNRWHILDNKKKKKPLYANKIYKKE